MSNIDDTLVLLSTADRGIDHTLMLLSTADDSIDDTLFLNYLLLI